MADENERRLTASSAYSIRKLMVKNFFGGIAWGVGSVIGATVVVSIVVFLLRSATFAPIVGDYVSGLIQGVQQNQVESLEQGIKK
jgi:hypothetical protein